MTSENAHSISLKIWDRSKLAAALKGGRLATRNEGQRFNEKRRSVADRF